VARTDDGLVVVVAHDVITPGVIFERHRPAPAGELAEVATRLLGTGERLEPLVSEYLNDRVRDVWRVRTVKG
jgi:hypothetical protein